MEDYQVFYHCTGHIPSDPNWSLKSHYHSLYEIVVVCRGILHINMEQNQIMARAGDVLLYPALVPHEEWFDKDDPAETYFVQFGWQNPIGIQQRLFHDAQGRIRQLITWIYQDRDSSNDLIQPQRNLMVAMILLELERISAGELHHLVRTIRNYMKLELSNSVSLEDLSNMVGLSKFHLVRRYKTLTGRTPMEDLRLMRIEHARNLILTTNLPLRVIAEKSGLADEFHLSHLFRRYLNLTPRELRRDVRRQALHEK